MGIVENALEDAKKLFEPGGVAATEHKIQVLADLLFQIAGDAGTAHPGLMGVRETLIREGLHVIEQAVT